MGGLACCSPWGHEESDMTERLNSNISVAGMEAPPPWGSQMEGVQGATETRSGVGESRRQGQLQAGHPTAFPALELTGHFFYFAIAESKLFRNFKSEVPLSLPPPIPLPVFLLHPETAAVVLIVELRRGVGSRTPMDPKTHVCSSH